MTTTVLGLGIWLSLALRVEASNLAPGVYVTSEHTIYVGVQHDPPGPASNDFFDSTTQRTGDVQATQDLQLRSGISEESRVIEAPQGRLGLSLYYAGEGPRATVILVHGNDPETREMGGQRADDVETIYDRMRRDPHVDAHRIGIWGFSNGGWTAPLVSIHRPLAFMILKSAPTESVSKNIDYEVEQAMRRHNADDASPQAIALWHAFEGSLDGSVSWSYTKRLYDIDAKQPWFQYSLMPELGISIPPPSSKIAGLRRLVAFDPTRTLRSVSSTPTLALYGVLDRNVDAADSAAHLREYLSRAGDHDVTIKMYPNAGHQLIVSESGYNGNPAPPQRFVPDYPQIMISWLAQRGFTTERPSPHGGKGEKPTPAQRTRP